MQLQVVIFCQVYLYAQGLQELLNLDEEIKVIGIGASAREIQTLMTYDPDAVVTDLACCRTVLEALPSGEDKKVLLLNGISDLSADTVREMIKDGLGGILPSEADASQLRKAVSKVNEGELWIDRQTMREIFNTPERKPHQLHLTRKEREVLGHVCAGLTNKEIARKLNVSEQTVKSHCNHLFKKFGVSTRLKLAINANKHFPESPGSAQ